MKQDQMTKLYAALTPAEQAAIAFREIANANEEGLKNVVDTVQRRTYTTLDLKYMQTLDCIFNMACMWGIQYWKLKALMLSSVVRLQDESDLRSWSERIASYEAAERLLVTHDRALSVVCEQYGIDEQAARRLSDAYRVDRPNVEIDQAYSHRTRSELSALLSNKRIPA